jgi:Short C-terminal domain
MIDKKQVAEQLKKAGYWKTVPAGDVAKVLQEGESILAACGGPGLGTVNLITNERIILLKNFKLSFECAHRDIVKLQLQPRWDDRKSVTLYDSHGEAHEIVLTKPYDARQNYLAILERGLKSKIEHTANPGSAQTAVTPQTEPTTEPQGASLGWRDKWKASREAASARGEERKAEKAELANIRGKELARALLGYAGGFDTDHTTNAGSLSLEGTLYCFENQVEYHKRNNDFGFSSDQIVHVEVGGQQQINSRISVTRMAALGVFSLAAPKRTTTKEAFVVFELADGRNVLFQTTTSTPFDMQRKLANAISFYNSRRTANVRPATSATAGELDQLEKLADLRDRGVITEQEFQDKKKQLLVSRERGSFTWLAVRE